MSALSRRGWKIGSHTLSLRAAASGQVQMHGRRNSREFIQGCLVNIYHSPPAGDGILTLIVLETRRPEIN